jgi:hypothetical protein
MFWLLSRDAASIDDQSLPSWQTYAASFFSAEFGAV